MPSKKQQLVVPLDASTVEVHDYGLPNPHSGQEEGLKCNPSTWPTGPRRAMFSSSFALPPPRTGMEAIQLYLDGVKESPKHDHAYLWCAEAARLCVHDVKKGQELATQSIRLRKSSQGYYVLGSNLLHQSRYKAGHQCAMIALELDPWREKVKMLVNITTTAMMDYTLIPGLMQASQGGGAGGAGARMSSHLKDLRDNSMEEFRCANCDPVHGTHDLVKGGNCLLRCSRCKSANYCSKECQKQAWKFHKLFCETDEMKESVFSGTSEAHKRIQDGWALPSLDDVVQVFGKQFDIRNMVFWAPQGTSAVNRKLYERKARKSNTSTLHYQLVQDDPDKLGCFRTMHFNVNSKYSLGLKDNKNVVDGEEGLDPDWYRAARIANRRSNGSAWSRYSTYLQNEKGLYVFLTSDYVDGLAAYLQRRFEEMGISYDDRSIIEVGCGNGRLSFHLEQRGIPIKATDDFSWKLGGNRGLGGDQVKIHNLDHARAVNKFKPQIVICAWMPSYKDLTAAFRKQESVREYILIGPAYTGTCGHLWDTWGGDSAETAVPRYQKEGFTRESLLELERLQLCRFDGPTEMFGSQTVSFRRQ